MNVDEIKQRFEQLFQQLENELYLEGAGLKESVNTSAIYERFADLAERSLLEMLREEVARATSTPTTRADEPERKLRLLLEAATQNYLKSSVRRLNDEILQQEADGFLAVDASEPRVSFRSSAVMLMNEPNRTRRAALARARDRFTGETLNPLLKVSFDGVQEEIRQLGYKNYHDLAEQLSGIDLFGLHTMTEQFLSETEDMYHDVFSWHVRKKLGISPKQVKKHDLSHLMRATEFDEFFPPDGMVDRVFSFVRSMGVDPTRRGTIHLDLEDRPRKSPRAFCSPVRIPEEVYLVLRPAGGLDDYRAFLHELGHALHFGYTSSTLDWEFKRLGDASVAEVFAMMFDHLPQSKRWLENVVGMRQSANYLGHAAFVELMMVRRYCAKLSYELVLHDGRPLNGKENVYREFLTRATKADHSSEQFLADVDPFFYGARYLRAWMLESMLRQYLVENFEEDWFRNPRAGDFLKELWSEGQRYDAVEFARRLAYPSLTMEFIRCKIEEVYGR
jgi:oligoendopeptidase F